MHSRPFDAPNTHRQHKNQRGLQILAHTHTIADDARGEGDDDGGARTDNNDGEFTSAGCYRDPPQLEVLTYDMMTCGIFLGEAMAPQVLQT